MPRRAKRKESATATHHGEQHKHQHPHPHAQHSQQLQQQHHQQQQQQQPSHLHHHEQQRRQQDVEYAFQKMFLNTSQRCFLRGNGRQSGGLESPYIKPNKSAKTVAKGSCNSVVSKTNQFPTTRKIKDSSKEVLGKTASSFDGWMLQKSKTSTSKIRAEPEKPTVSPLARNRFYELRDKTPVRDRDRDRDNTKLSTQQLLKKDSIIGQQQRMELGWNPLKTSSMHMTKPSTPGTGLAANKKPSHHLDTYLNVDGNRNWAPFQLSNWRAHQEPKPFFEVATLHFPEPPPPCRPENPSRIRIADLSLRYRKPLGGENEKIAPLHNLATPVRDLWVTKPEHAELGELRCVTILPEHHQCAGPERNLTPNDVDTKSLASKLEKHSRLPEYGSRAVQCICFRQTRRAYCTVCKATIIGRAFRKCRMHPEVGFLTDHFYCPFCRAEPSALKDI